MEAHLFWFNDEQCAKIEPHLPANQPGPRRKDDRLILRGNIQVRKASANFPLRFRPKGRLGNEAGARGWLPLGRLPEGVRPPQDDRQSLCPLEAENLGSLREDSRSK